MGADKAHGKAAQVTSSFVTEDAALDELKPHPRNYQAHPDDEIAHLMESISEHGLYRNVVVAQDGITILAGHGVVQAARQLGLTHVPVYRVDYVPDDPRALKLLAGDNEIRHLADVDDRALTELLRELHEQEEVGLLGTGYDEMMLATLAMVTRPASEIEDFDAAAQWVGMPDYDGKGEDRIRIIVNFACDEHRREFCARLGLEASQIPMSGPSSSIWWPTPRGRDDMRSLLFTDREASEDA